MTTTGKFSFQPSIGNHFCQTYAQNTLAHAEDVGIVMLTAHFSGENITAQSSANTLAFISSDRNTDTGTANQMPFCAPLAPLVISSHSLAA